MCRSRKAEPKARLTRSQLQAPEPTHQKDRATAVKSGAMGSDSFSQGSGQVSYKKSLVECKHWVQNIIHHCSITVLFLWQRLSHRRALRYTTVQEMPKGERSIPKMPMCKHGPQGFWYRARKVAEQKYKVQLGMHEIPCCSAGITHRAALLLASASTGMPPYFASFSHRLGANKGVQIKAGTLFMQSM